MDPHIAEALGAAAAQLRRDVELLLSQQAAHFEAELLDRQHRIESLTAQLARATAAPASPRDSAALDRVFAAFATHLTLGDDNEDRGLPGAPLPAAADAAAAPLVGAEADDGGPAPVAASSPPEPARPVLASRLSASGTNFEKFSSVARLSRTSRGSAAIGGTTVLASSTGNFMPVPVAELQEAGGRMEPQPRPMASGTGMRNKQIHLNDVSSLSVKQRRKQTLKQTQTQPQSTMASDSDASIPDMRALTAPDGLPSAATGAPEPISTSQNCSDRDAPLRRHSVNAGTRGASPVLARDNTVAMQTFPSRDLVQEALLERSPSTSSSSSPLTKRVVRRKESVIMRKFRSAFPSSKHRREQLVRSESSAANLNSNMDGGFTEHAKEASGRAGVLTARTTQFKQLPLFERSADHHVETYPQSPGWSFSMDTLAAPSCFERPFEVFCNNASVRPRLWVWQNGLCVIVAVPTEDDSVRLVLHCSSGTQSVLVQLANIDVLSKAELLRQLLAVANPLIPADECVRVRGEAAARLKASTLLFERRFTPQSIDVAVVKYLRPDACPESPLISSDGKRRTKGPLTSFERFVALMTGRSDGVAETGECVSYVWSNCTIRLNFVSSKDARALALYRVRLCFTEGDLAVPAQDSGADVVVAVREASGLPKYFQLSCLHKAAVPHFGPPLFPEPLRDKLLQPVLSCKLLNAVAMLRHTLDTAQLCAERAVMLKTIIEGV